MKADCGVVAQQYRRHAVITISFMEHGGRCGPHAVMAAMDLSVNLETRIEVERRRGAPDSRLNCKANFAGIMHANGT